MDAATTSVSHRCYSAEYQAKVAKARALGYPSYWAYRVARWGPDPRSSRA